MVQSPWREDDKWENTGLRAGEAEKGQGQSKSARPTAGKPAAPVPWGRTAQQTALPERPSGLLGGEGTLPLMERTLHINPQPSGHTTLPFTSLKMKAAL